MNKLHFYFTKLALLATFAQLIVVPSVSADEGDILIAMNGPSASTLAIGSDDVPLINFTIVNTEELISFTKFPISLDFSSDTSDLDAGLLASGVLPNVTDVKIIDTDTGEVVFGPIDTRYFTTSLAGATFISEVNDDELAYYLFTGDLTMSAGEARNLALTVDIAKESALNASTLYGTLALGTSYPTILDSTGTVLDNSTVLIPHSAITSKKMTLAAPSDTSAVDLTMSSVSMGDNYALSFRIGNSGEDDLDVSALDGNAIKVRILNPAGSQVGSRTFPWSGIASYTTAGSDKQLIKYLYKYEFLSKLKVGKTYTAQVCIDPDGVVEEWNSDGDAEDNCATTTFVMGALPDLAVLEGSYDASTYTFSSTVSNVSDTVDVKAINDGYYVVALNGAEVERLNWAEEGPADVDYLNAGVSQTISNSLEDSELSLLISGENTWEVCVDADNKVKAETSETNNCFSGTFTVEPTSTAFLEMSIASDTPAEDIVVAGSTGIEMTRFNLAAVGDSFLVQELTVKNRYDSVPGDLDHNISSVILEYENEAGVLVATEGILMDGEAHFSGLEVYVPLDETVALTVYADLMPIISSGSSATAGDLIELNPSMEGLEAIAVSSGASFTGSGEDLTEANVMHIYETGVNFTLSSSSPSGVRTVTSTDNAFIFKITAESGEKVSIHELRIDMESDADFDTSKTVQARLYDSGIPLSSSVAVVFIDTSNAYVTFTGDFEIAEGSTKTITLNLSTTDLLDEDAGVDDPLTFFIDHGSSSDGTVTAGGITWDDTNEEIHWIGKTSSTSLVSNTVFY